MPLLPDKVTNVEVQIALTRISSEQNTITTLLEKEPKITEDIISDKFSKEQLKNQQLQPLILRIFKNLKFKKLRMD